MCYLRHKLKFLLFCGKFMFRSQDIQVFVFETISSFTKSVKSWWVLIHVMGCIFEYIFWTTTHSVTILGQLIDISKKYFSGILWTIWRTDGKFQGFFNLVTCSNYSVISYVQIPVFHIFEKVNKGQLKMVNVNYYKWPYFVLIKS